jgi:hypothetical protein
MRQIWWCWLISVCLTSNWAFADSVPAKTAGGTEATPLLPDAVFAETLPVQLDGSVHSAHYWSTVEPSAAMQPAAEPTRVFVAPYVWVPAMKGEVTALGMTNSVDLSLGDAFSALGDLKGAAQGHVEVGRGDWTLIMDTMLMRIGESHAVTAGKLEADIGATFLELMAARRIGGERLRERDIVVELLGGARYYQVNADAIFLPNNPLLPNIPAEQTEEWVDLVFGARTAVPLTQRISGFARGDFAGFGIGTSSTLTWNLVAGVEYVHTDACWWTLGYRILDIDEHQSSAGRDFAFDVKLHGPFLAILFRF